LLVSPERPLVIKDPRGWVRLSFAEFPFNKNQFTERHTLILGV
jgi:hypothetical protein